MGAETEMPGGRSVQQHRHCHQRQPPALERCGCTARRCHLAQETHSAEVSARHRSHPHTQSSLARGSFGRCSGSSPAARQQLGTEGSAAGQARTTHLDSFHVGHDWHGRCEGRFQDERRAYFRMKVKLASTRSAGRRLTRKTTLTADLQLPENQI